MESVLKAFSESADKLLEAEESTLKLCRESNTSKGLSLLELKNHLLLQYMIDLTGIIKKKLTGISIAEDPDILKLAEVRTSLEKIRPIEKKLKYQIDKLLKTAAAGEIDANDPLSFKPRPENLMSQDDDDEEDEDDDEGGKDKQKTKLYRPPKLVAMHYEESESDKTAKVAERARQRALSANVIKEAFRELDDRPEEINDQSMQQSSTQERYMKEKAKFEEKYMVRMNVSKKEKQAMKRQREGGLDDLLKFENIQALTEGYKGGKGKKGKRNKMGVKKGRIGKKRKFRKK